MRSLYPNYQEKKKDYLEQWDRVCRWYAKVKSIELKYYDKKLSPDTQQDFLLSFFFNAFILKDWIKKTKTDQGIEEIFNGPTGRQSLMVLADFVTNYKHFDNSRRNRLDKNTWLVSRDGVSDPVGPTHTWWIESQGKKINLYRLADDVFNDLSAYLKSKHYI